MTWLRLHTEILNDPKVQTLDPEVFKVWINLLCIAKENDGELPSLQVMAFQLRMDQSLVIKVIDELVKSGLVDKTKRGFTPHNWNGRQYVSDVSTNRVKRYRERQRNVSETSPETETETETDSETEKEEGANAPPNGASPYAWRGKVIKLERADYDLWQRSYSHLDLNAELLARDTWLSEQGAEVRKRWFQSTATHFANRNSNAMSKRGPPPTDMVGGLKLHDL